MLSLAIAELFVFSITSDLDKMVISLLAISQGLRYIINSTDKINLKEENNNEKWEYK